MMKPIAIAAILTIAATGAASACANGYKAVWIQGNKVCQIDASASNTLTSKPKWEPRHTAAKKVR